MSQFKPYPAYKDSGVAWLREVPEHWKSVRLKYLFNLVKRKVRDDDRIVTCFRDGEVTLRDNRRTEGFTNALKEIGYQGIRAGDLVLHAMDAFAGAIGVSDSDGKSSPVYSVCAPVSPSVSAHYYARLLRNMAVVGFVTSLAKGIRERSTDFRWADASEIFLPFPPEAEQKNIVAFLDHETARIDALIEEQQRLIELLKEKRQAVISHAVTKGLDSTVPMKNSDVEWLGQVPAHWDICPLKFSASCNDIVLPDSTDEEYEIEYVEISNVDEISGITGSSRYKFSAAPSRARRMLQDGDVLVSTVRTYLRAIAPVVSPPRNLIASTGFAVIRPSKGVLSGSFLGYLMRAEWWISEVISRSVGVSCPSINASDLIALSIVLPALSEQTQIARFLDHETALVDALVDEANAGAGFLQERHSALISAAVTGKIDVRGWQPPASALSPELEKEAR